MRSGRLVGTKSLLSVMIVRALISFLLCCSILAADTVGSIVVADDNKQYKLVKTEKALPNGAIEIAEYVLVGDTSGARYAKRLTPAGSKPSFWKITKP